MVYNQIWLNVFWMIAIKSTTSQFFLKATFYIYSKDINYFEFIQGI
jgi:hypothetical protein